MLVVNVLFASQYTGVFSSDVNFQISEIRALTPPNTNLMALTATASLSTRKSITKTLEMTDCKVVARVPNNLNTRFALLPIPTSPQRILDPLIKELIQHGTKSERTIVFCRSYRVLLELENGACQTRL